MPLSIARLVTSIKSISIRTVAPPRQAREVDTLIFLRVVSDRRLQYSFLPAATVIALASVYKQRSQSCGDRQIRMKQ